MATETETETMAQAQQAEQRFRRFMTNVSEEGQIKADARVIDLLRRIAGPVQVVPVDSATHYANAKKSRENKLDTRLTMMTNERLNVMNKINYEKEQERKKQNIINNLKSI